MITRVQNSGGPTHSALDYNENKVSEGVATVVAHNGVADASWFSIMEAFREREALPSVDPRIRNLVLHMTVNPGSDDNMSRGAAVAYIRELMHELGYSGQPYVVYRHNDIEREHYHIVASNIMPDGHAVDSKYIGLRAIQVQKSLADKYGFTPGVPDAEAAVKKPSPGFIHKGDGDVLARMRANIDEVFRYNCRDGLQMRAAFLSFGMELRSSSKEDKTYYSFRCMDEDGVMTKRPVSIRRAAGVDAEGFMARMKNLFDRGKEEAAPNDKTIESIRKALDETIRTDDRMDTFRRLLSAKGISLFAVSGAKTLPAKPGEEADFLFVDRGRRAVVTLQETGIPLETILALRRSDEKRKKKDLALEEDNKHTRGHKAGRGSTR